MTPEDLRNIEHRYRCAAEHAEDLRAERNAAIREALAEGWTHARVSEATGLSRGRISQVKRPTGEGCSADG